MHTCLHTRLHTSSFTYNKIYDDINNIIISIKKLEKLFRTICLIFQTSVSCNFNVNQKLCVSTNKVYYFIPSFNFKLNVLFKVEKLIFIHFHAHESYLLYLYYLGSIRTTIFNECVLCNFLFYDIYINSRSYYSFNCMKYVLNYNAITKISKNGYLK